MKHAAMLCYICSSLFPEPEWRAIVCLRHWIWRHLYQSLQPQPLPEWRRMQLDLGWKFFVLVHLLAWFHWIRLPFDKHY